MKNISNEMMSLDKRLVAYNTWILQSNPQNIHASEFIQNYLPNYLDDPYFFQRNVIFYIPTKQHILIPDSWIKLEHELAHILEMKDNSRIVENDFGFNNKDIIEYKETINSFIVGLACESRVRAIETVIKGKKLSDEELSKGRFTNEQWGVVWNKIRMKYGDHLKFKTIKEISGWSAHIMSNTYKSWDQDKIMHVWNNKLNYIRNWMESK